MSQEIEPAPKQAPAFAIALKFGDMPEVKAVLQEALERHTAGQARIALLEALLDRCRAACRLPDSLAGDIAAANIPEI